jgi:phage-related protein
MQKSCKFRGSKIAKKGFVLHVFRKIAKSSFSSKNKTKQNEVKRSKKRSKEVKRKEI